MIVIRHVTIAVSNGIGTMVGERRQEEKKRLG